MVCSNLDRAAATFVTAESVETFLNVHFVLPSSGAHGPGLRCVVWVQGCTLACSGCCNPGTHATTSGSLCSVADLLERLESRQDEIEGVTISGGEPLQQPEALLEFVEEIRVRTDLSILLSTGYEISEVRGQPLGPRILDKVDVIVAGRFDREKALECSLIGSSNRRVYLLTDRYSSDEIEAAMGRHL